MSDYLDYNGADANRILDADYPKMDKLLARIFDIQILEIQNLQDYNVQDGRTVENHNTKLDAIAVTEGPFNELKAAIEKLPVGNMRTNSERMLRLLKRW